MKIIITEKQADKLFGNEVTCKKCNHSWETKNNDKNPFLCHICGWDQKVKKYKDTELLNFWKNHE